MPHATVEQLRYYSADSGFTVASIRTTEGETLTATFMLPTELAPGQEIEIEGEVSDHPRYGRQMKATRVDISQPTTEEGVRAYLSSGIIAGIGPATAQRIVEAFGPASLDILDKDPQRLVEVKGIGQKTLPRIMESWGKNRQGAVVIGELYNIGLTVNIATKIYKLYGGDSVRIVRENPYRLADEVEGIGFRRADEIALKMGFAKDNPFRISSGILFTLKEALSEGHCFLPEAELASTAGKILGVSHEQVAAGMGYLLNSDQVVKRDRMVRTTSVPVWYLLSTYAAETSVGSIIKRLASMQPQAWTVKLDNRLTQEQQQGVMRALQYRLSVITGPAGSGKTFVLSEIIRCLEKRGISFALTAPTGRASKRITETTGQPASTIHRLIGYGQMKVLRRGPDNPLEEQVVIVDESSMVDLFLMDQLLKALSPSASLLLVGDAHQLAPIGPGLVFKDIIDSGVCPVTRLTKIQRQREGASIITIANAINEGVMPVIPNAGDSYLFEKNDPQKAAETVVDLYMRRIPEKFGIPPDDIMIISPMRKGPLGTENINRLIQAAVLPQEAPELKGFNFRVGDRVMQLVNSYENLVFNGELGRVVDIDFEDKVLFVTFEGFEAPIRYEYAQLNRLALSYAVSVHKSQGSQYRAVIVLCSISAGHRAMMRRSLLYTAATRSRELLVMVGEKRALSVGIHNAEELERHTGLLKQEAVND